MDTGDKMSIPYKVRVSAQNKKEADKKFREISKRWISDYKINDVTKKRHIWGIVHKMSFDGKNLVIGGKVKG